MSVDHQHCPRGCEHPQPISVGSDFYCGRCWFVHKQVTLCVPCTPDVCGD